MKKIGILTYHRSINYGALMQAYSLSERLAKEFPDYKVEIIDYMSETADKLYHPSFYKYIKIGIKQKNLRKKAIFFKQAILFIFKKLRGEYKLSKVFEDQLKQLRLSDDYIVTDDEGEFFRKINNKYTVIIVGSDAVFNWQIRNFPSPYFISGDLGALKFSYAASSYGQDYTLITEDQKLYISDAWKKFSYIGVRDKATEDFVRSVAPFQTPHHNCDPTVFLDLDTIPVDEEEVKTLLKKAGVDISKPIIGLMAQDWLGKLVHELLGRHYQVVAVFKDNPYADFYLENLTPFQWAKVFRFFSVTFTHFFHGNLLSLKNGTPTIIIENKSQYNIKHNSKVRDLMKRIGLMDFCYYRDEIGNKKQEIISAVVDRINNREKYQDRIYQGLDQEAQTYQDFYCALKNALEEISLRRST